MIAKKKPTSMTTLRYWNGDVVAMTTTSSLTMLRMVLRINPEEKNPATKVTTKSTTPQYKRLRRSSRYGKNFSMVYVHYTSDRWYEQKIAASPKQS